MTFKEIKKIEVQTYLYCLIAAYACTFFLSAYELILGIATNVRGDYYIPLGLVKMYGTKKNIWMRMLSVLKCITTYNR